MPDDFDETLDAPVEPGTRAPRLPIDPVEMPVFRPRRQTRQRFWLAFVLALAVVVLAALVIATVA